MGAKLIFPLVRVLLNDTGYAVPNLEGHIASGRAVFISSGETLGLKAHRITHVTPLDGFNIVAPYLPPAIGNRLRMVGNFGVMLLFLLIWYDTPVATWFWSEIFLVADGFHIPGWLVAQGFEQFGW